MIYLTDASRDNSTGVSSISFIDKTSNNTENIQTLKFKNIFEAELEGIKLCILDAFRKYSNVVIFCDNKQAVFSAFKEFNTKLKLKERFRSVQFVWLPREHLNEADFLTKNINDLDKNKKLKTLGTKNKLKGDILNIMLTKEDYIELIFKEFNKIPKTSMLFNSKIMKDLEKGAVPTSIREEISSKVFYDDVKNILSIYPSLSKRGSSLQLLIEMLNKFNID